MLGQGPSPWEPRQRRLWSVQHLHNDPPHRSSMAGLHQGRLASLLQEHRAVGTPHLSHETKHLLAQGGIPTPQDTGER
jgi:hypothetical protein